MARSSNIYHDRPASTDPASAAAPTAPGLPPFDFRRQMRRRALIGGALIGGISLVLFAVVIVSDSRNRRRIQETIGRRDEAAAISSPGDKSAVPERRRLTLEMLAPNLVRSLAPTNATEAAASPEAVPAVSPETRARAQRLLDQARLAGASGDHGTALDLLEAARTLAPDLPGLDAYLGYIRLQREEYPAAVELLEAALARDGPNSELLNQLAIAYAARGDRPRAIDLLEQLITRDSYHAEGLANLGRLQLEQGLYDAAREHLSSYVTLFPTDARAHDRLGFAYLNLDRIDRAYESFHQAQQIDPGNTQFYIHLAVATALAQSPGEGIRLIERAQPTLGRTDILAELANPLFSAVRQLPGFIQLQRAVTEAGATHPSAG